MLQGRQGRVWGMVTDLELNLDPTLLFALGQASHFRYYKLLKMG